MALEEQFEITLDEEGASPALRFRLAAKARCAHASRVAFSQPRRRGEDHHRPGGGGPDPEPAEVNGSARWSRRRSPPWRLAAARQQPCSGARALAPVGKQVSYAAFYTTKPTQHLCPQRQRARGGELATPMSTRQPHSARPCSSDARRRPAAGRARACAAQRTAAKPLAAPQQLPAVAFKRRCRLLPRTQRRFLASARRAHCDNAARRAPAGARHTACFGSVQHSSDVRTLGHQLPDARAAQSLAGAEQDPTLQLCIQGGLQVALFAAVAKLAAQADTIQAQLDELAVRSRYGYRGTLALAARLHSPVHLRLC